MASFNGQHLYQKATDFCRQMLGVMLPGEEGYYPEVELQYHNLALRIIQGDFKERFMREQRRMLMKRANKLRKLLNMEPGEGDAAADVELDDDDDAGAEDEEDTEDEEAVDEELQNELHVAALLIEDISRLMRKELAELMDVEKVIHETIKNTETDSQGSKVGSDGGGHKELCPAALMKKCMLRLCMAVDPIATVCADQLGKLHLRTPAFFLESRMAEFVFHKFTEYDSKASLVPKHRMEPTAFVPASHEMYSYIDERVKCAGFQDDIAVIELLQLLSSHSISKQSRLHLVRAVGMKFEQINREDTDLIDHGKGQCAVTANWPHVDQWELFGTGLNAPAYEELTRKLVNLPKDLIGSAHVITPKLSNILQKVKKHNQNEDDQLPINAVLPAYKTLLDENFTEAMQKDAYLHVTPMLMLTLQTILKQGFGLLTDQMMLAYADESGLWKPNHWTERRSAAAAICQLAADGNELAISVLAKKLLRDNHWMVCQTALAFACWLLGRLRNGVEHPRMGEILERLLTCAFDPREFSGPKQGNANIGVEAEHQKLSNLKSTVVDGLAKELLAYPLSIQKHVVDRLLGKRGHYSEVGADVFASITKGLKNEQSGNTRKQANAALNSMRVAREEQAMYHHL